MRLHLALGFHHKAQADRVATQLASDEAQAKSTCIPKRVQQAGPCAQFSQAAFGPGQVIGFFRAGRQKMRPELRVLGGQGLRGIQRLRTDLAHMVDPHERTGLLAFSVCHGHRGHTHRRVGARGMVRRKHGAQGLVEGVDEGVHGCHRTVMCCFVAMSRN